MAQLRASPSQQAVQRKLDVLLADVLARLPDNYREVLILRHLNGLSHETVAQRMNRTAGAVRMLWTRVLVALRQELQWSEF